MCPKYLLLVLYNSTVSFRPKLSCPAWLNRDMKVSYNSSNFLSRFSWFHSESVDWLKVLTVVSFVRKGTMGDGCLLDGNLGKDGGLSKDFTGVHIVGIFEGDFLGPSCTG